MVDAHHCADASKFIAVLLMSATMMLQLELPAVNVLSKVDLIEQYGSLRKLVHNMALFIVETVT